jgi:hypothetical protein
MGVKGMGVKGMGVKGMGVRPTHFTIIARAWVMIIALLSTV